MNNPEKVTFQKEKNVPQNEYQKKLAERYTRMWLETRSGIPKPHSWEHTLMVTNKSQEIGRLFNMTDEELEALYIASLGHDAIQPGLIKDKKLIEKMKSEWGYNPDGDEATESAKATKYVISSDSWQKRTSLSDKMIKRIIESIGEHSVRIGPGGKIEEAKEEKPFEEWDKIAKSIYIADKIVNQEPLIFFALSNFTPYKGSNERPFAALRRTDPRGVSAFLKTWFKKREHLMERKDLAEWLKKADPQIQKKISYLKKIINEFDHELEILEKRPELKNFLESCGIMAAIRFSQEEGRDSVNKSEAEIAKKFINHIEQIDKEGIIGDDKDRKRVFEFVKKFIKKLKEVLKNYSI